MANPLIEKLKSGGCIGCHWSILGSPSIVELMCESEVDAIVFDLQHGLWTRTALEHGIGVVRGKTAPICRVEDGSYFSIGSALDAGAVGVIVPMIETAEQALACVEAAKYPPEGRRSTGGVRAIVNYKSYLPQANANTLVAVMIETAKGVENAAAIAAVPGVDCVFIGPFDLSLSLGTFPDNGPKHEAAMQAILAACRATGKACGLFTPYATMAADRRQQGFQWVVLANDQDLIQGPSKAAVRRFQQGAGKDLVEGGRGLARPLTPIVSGYVHAIGNKQLHSCRDFRELEVDTNTGLCLACLIETTRRGERRRGNWKIETTARGLICLSGIGTRKETGFCGQQQTGCILPGIWWVGNRVCIQLVCGRDRL